jgi:hypothetical protein
MKKILGALLIGGAVAAGIYAARNQIKAAVLNLRDNLVARAHLVFDNPGEDEEEGRDDVVPDSGVRVAPWRKESADG